MKSGIPILLNRGTIGQDTPIRGTIYIYILRNEFLTNVGVQTIGHELKFTIRWNEGDCSVIVKPENVQSKFYISLKTAHN